MAVDTGEDPFRRLPDDLLRQVLSFLPNDYALQTCVLDTRWRDLWRRTTSLNFYFYNWEYDIVNWKRFKRFKQIVNLLIQLRGNSQLAKCEISWFPDEKDCEQLIEYSLMCQVKELIVSSSRADKVRLRYDAPFISQHLKIIEFFYLDLEGSLVDFSNCPVLEDLKMNRCRIEAPKISSKSLKCLCITDQCTFPEGFQVHIDAPDLTLLQIQDFKGLTPSLGNMPFLVTAYVRLGPYCHDSCTRNGQGCGDFHCGCNAYPVNRGVLLNGLSNAVSLELTGVIKMFLYRWDLKLCPIFDKLKTLLLNEWFTTTDLVCILQHAPILELLTLQLSNTQKFVRETGAQETIEQSFVCTHLKAVNIECRKTEEGICKILKTLSICGILREKISIKDPCTPSAYFSFQKPPHFFCCSSSCCSSHIIDVLC